MRRLLVPALALLLAGCGTGVTSTDETAASSPASTPAKADAPAPVSPVPPEHAYVLKNRLHVGGQQLPGKYAGLTSHGDTWIAYVRGGDSPGWIWGVGTTVHPVPGAVVQLSPRGRYVATATDNGCSVDEGACVLRFFDTRTGRKARLGLRGRFDLIGVTDQGAVLVKEGNPQSRGHKVWEAARGATSTRPVVEVGVMSGWAMNDWDAAFGNAGLTLCCGNIRGQWLGELVDGEVRRGRPIPKDVEPGPAGHWWVLNAWINRVPRTPGAGRVATTRAIEVRQVRDDGGHVRLPAPEGWTFAAADWSGVVQWEDADTFLARVVDARGGGDRLARCDIPLATCVLVEES